MKDTLFKNDGIFFLYSGMLLRYAQLALKFGICFEFKFPIARNSIIAKFHSFA